jgi:hypothetical protein
MNLFISCEHTKIHAAFWFASGDLEYNSIEMIANVRALISISLPGKLGLAIEGGSGIPSDK